jgi:hypothetical protein
MQSTLNQSMKPARARLTGRIALAAVALIGLCTVTSSAEAGRRDRAGHQEIRQAQLVLKRVQRLEQTSLRAIDRAPDATVRLLDLLVTRSATPSELHAIALRGSHKVSIQRRLFEDQVRRYTDGIIQASVTVVEDEDGNVIPPDIDAAIEGTIQILRDDLVSEDLIMQIIEARQSALNAIQDAALAAEAEINSALDAAVAALPTP